MPFRNIQFYILLFFSLSVNAQRENYIKLPDQNITLYYEDVGSGNPIIFIPGWTMTTRFFSKQKEYFSKQYRFITFDPRSQGESEKTPVGNSYDVHAQDLAEFIKLLKLKNVVLVGWSSGCITMFEYLKQFGTENIKQVFFIDETPKWIGDSENEWVYGNFDDYRSSLLGLTRSRTRDAVGTVNWMLQNPVSDNDKEWMINDMLKTPNYAALSLYIDGLASNYIDVVKHIKTPFKSAFFLRDSWYGKASLWLNKEAPSYNTVAITSHAMFWEKPKKFNQLLMSCLKE